MTNNYSDATLVAFLDGELSDSETAEIAQAAESDAMLQQRIEILGPELDTAELKSAFDSLLVEAPEYQQKTVVQTKLKAPGRKQSVIWGTIAAGAVAASLVMGVFIGLRQGERVQTWQEFAAAYHVLYREKTLVDVVVNEEKSLTLARQFGFALDDQTRVADEFELIRVQNLGFNDKPILHVAYLAENGQPMALCLIPSSAGPTGIENKELYSIATASWRDEKFEYVVLGGADQAQVDRFTRGIGAKI